MSDHEFWEYQILDNGEWTFAAASGQNPHHYGSREEVMRILQIIHPGERVRLVKFEEVTVPES